MGKFNQPWDSGDLGQPARRGGHDRFRFHIEHLAEIELPEVLIEHDLPITRPLVRRPYLSHELSQALLIHWHAVAATVHAVARRGMDHGLIDLLALFRGAADCVSPSLQ